MSDNVKFVLDADIAKAEAQVDKLTAKIANIQERLRSGERVGDTERTASAVDSMAQSAASFAAGMVGAHTVMSGMRAIASAIVADMERIKALGQEANQTRVAAAGARSQALREGLGIFGGASSIDALAKQAASAGVPIQAAYQLVASAASVGGGLSADRISQIVMQAARQSVVEPSMSGPQYVSSLVRGARLFPARAAGEIAGFMGQFAQKPEEMAALADVLEVGREYGVNLHHAAGLFGQLDDVSGDTGAASAILRRLITGASGSDALPSGVEMVEAGRIQGGGIRYEPRPRRVPVTGTGLRERLHSIAAIFGAAETTDDQRGDIMRTLTGRGSRSPEGAFIRGLLSDPARIDEFFAGVDRRPRLGAAAARAEEQLRGQQLTGLGGDLAAATRVRAASEGLSAADAVGAARERLRSAMIEARRRGDMSMLSRATAAEFTGESGLFGSTANLIKGAVGVDFGADTEGNVAGFLAALQKNNTETNKELVRLITELLDEFRRARSAEERAAYDGRGPRARSEETALEAVGN